MAQIPKSSFRIEGRVIGQVSRQGTPTLRVQAWDKDLIGSAVTDRQGAFTIEFTHSYFQELFFDRRPDVFFRVFLRDKLIKNTEGSVLWNVEAGDTLVEIEVAMPDAPQTNTDALIITGQISHQDGNPLTGAAVHAFDRDMRSEEALGHTRSDPTGHYEIRYTAEQFRRFFFLVMG